MSKLLKVKDLTVQYETDEDTIHAVNGVSFELEEGKTLGIVGETGAGKTTTCLSILRLISETSGRITGGEIYFRGEDVMKKSELDMRKIRGSKISMIFQDPMTALNPVMQVGKQISEVIRKHQKCSRLEATARAQEMLKKVGIAPERCSDYPHQFSGGMKQRVVIAMALACNPALLLADEPTTALDVTIQAQMLEMIKDLQMEFNTAMVLITHDLGIVAETCDSVGIMYAGEMVEYGTAEDIFEHAVHPYTIGLFQAIPSIDEKTERLKVIPGLMPDPADLPKGCKFSPRCGYSTEQCKTQVPPYCEIAPGHFLRCFCDNNKEEE